VKFEDIDDAESIAVVAKTILRHRVYLDVYSAFYDWLHHPGKIKRMSICTNEDDKIVGAALMVWEPDRNYYGCNIGVYVKRTFRHQGIGTRLIKRLPGKKSNRRLIWSTGIRGSEQFFSRLTRNRKEFNLIFADDCAR